MKYPNLLPLLLLSSGAIASEAQRPPNILVIMVDDLGWGDLGCYPKGKGWNDEAKTPTPEIDRLASTGVRCTQGYTTGMVCAPSRAGLLTGRYPEKFGYFGFEDSVAPIPDSIKLLPQALKEAGYRTGMVGKWHVSSAPGSWPLDRGFESFFGFIGGQHDYFEANIGETMHGVGCSSDAFLYDQKTPVSSVKFLTDEFTDRAMAFMGQRSDKPFFLYLAYNAPHPPLQVPWEYLEKYALNRPGGKFTSRDLARALIENLDANIGRLVAWLGENGMRDNTLIVLTSDNGGHDDGPDRMLQHNGGLKGRKGTWYEGGIRVPLIVSWPAGLPKGEVYTEPISQLDLYPTFVALDGSNQPPPPSLEGVNLIPYFTGLEKERPHREMFWCLEADDKWAIRQDDWKLVREDMEPATLGTKKGRDKPRDIQLQLFNLAADPEEKQNLVAERPEIVSALQQRFDEIHGSLPPALATPAVISDWKAALAERAKVPALNNVSFRIGSPGHWKNEAKKPAQP